MTLTYGRLWLDPATGSTGSWEMDLRPWVAIKAKRVFPRMAQHRSAVLSLAATDEASNELLWFIGRYPLEVDDRTLRQLRKRARRHDSMVEDTRLILEGTLRGEHPREPARPFREHQLANSDLCLRTGRLLVADPLGGGKTSSVLALLRNPDALPLVVFTLTHLPPQWAKELRTVWPDLRVHLVKRRLPYPIERVCGGKPPHVLIMSYAKLAGWAEHLMGLCATIAFDEAQELRRRGTPSDPSLKYDAAAMLAPTCAYRIETTATPVYNYGGETYNVIDVIAPGELGAKEEFVREWGASTHHDHVIVADPRALGTYLRDVGLMVRHTEAACGISQEEPTLITVPIESSRRALDVVAEDVRTLAQRILNRADEDAKEQRSLRGELDWKLRQATGVAKAPHVADFARMLLDSERRLVLWGWHRAVYDIWLDLLKPYDPVLYTGTESPAQKANAVDSFLVGRSRVLIMSLRSGAGLDGLQEGCNVGVFGELDWSPEVMAQCVGRLRRPGQLKTVIGYTLVCDEGSDPVISDTLGLKVGQAVPIRDPNAPLVQPATDGGDKVLDLARAVLERRSHLSVTR